jgi:hypothetical protein
MEVDTDGNELKDVDTPANEVEICGRRWKLSIRK